MKHGGGDLFFPTANAFDSSMRITVDSNVNLIAQGTDPKPLVLDYCKP